ncbi:hypothetical protein MKW92_049448 [Papaver armeniacum]|nr:hypothetical protein MKW92_049448 [Papaver armeniacum]
MTKFAAFGTIVGVGVSLNNYQSLDGCDSCDVRPEVVRQLLKFGACCIVSFFSSTIVALTTKYVGRWFRNKNKDTLKRKILRSGFFLSSSGAAVGVLFLGLYFAKLFEIKFWAKSCGNALSISMIYMYWTWGVVACCFIFLSVLFTLVR